MFKRIVLIIFCCLLLTPFAQAVNNTALSNNEESLYKDVSIDDWYYDSVYTCRQTGIFEGDETTQFYPYREITLQESYAVLARLHQQYNNSTMIISSNEESWSAPFLTYCVEHEIIFPNEIENHDVLNREIFALFLSRIYDLSSFDKINEIIDIVDYNVTSDLGKTVLALYQTGIIGGTNDYGCFSPLGKLSRAECATIVARLIYPEKRIEITTSAVPLNLQLNFMSTAATVYDFDGKFIYLLDPSDNQNPLYYVTDLYGRKIMESREYINRQQNGIFKCYISDASQTFFYNISGELIYKTSGSFDYYSFLYGKFALNQNDGSILVIDTQGQKINSIDSKGLYRVVGAAFGDYIQVAPNEIQDQSHSYWMNAYSGMVTELPYSAISAYTAPLESGYMVLGSYDENAGQFLHNVINTSLNFLFPQMMNSVKSLENGVLLAESSDTYYIVESDNRIKQYPKNRYGKIIQFSSSNRILQYTSDGRTQISDLITGEVYATFPAIDTYLIVGRKIVRPRNIRGETVVDLFDEHGAQEQSGIPSNKIWYSNMGQILYQIENQYYYISA